MVITTRPYKPPKTYSTRTIKDFQALGQMIQKELLFRIRNAPKPAEMVALDHVIAIGTVNFMKTAAWRPLIIGGVHVQENGRLLLCRLSEGEIYFVRVIDSPVRTSRLGMSGAICYTPPRDKKIAGTEDLLDKSSILLYLTD